jgi:tetratricopeptide (TPR) repeat protein
VLDMLGVYYGMGGKESRGESLLREAQSAVETSADGDLRRKLTCDHAMTLAMISKVSEAIQELNAVIEDPQLTDRQAVDCMTYLADTAERTEDPASALKFANLALQRLHQVENPSPTLEASVLSSLGDAENLNGHNGAADQFYARALAEYAQAGRDGGPNANIVRNNWAVASSGAGNPKRALELIEQIIRIIAQNDPTARTDATLMFNRARELEFLGRFREAREGYSQCATLEQADRSMGRVVCQIGLASVSRELGDMASADSYLSAASAGVAASPPGSPAGVRLKMQRAAITLARGRLEGVRADLDAAIAESKNIYLLMESLRTRAELNLNENKLAAAEADARRALALAQAAQGDEPFSNRTGAGWLILGRVLVKEADAGRAQSALRAAIENLSNTVDADHPMLLLARQLARD